MKKSQINGIVIISAVLIDEGNNQYKVTLSKTNTGVWIALNQKGTLYPLLTEDGNGIKDIHECQSVFIDVAIPMTLK